MRLAVLVMVFSAAGAAHAQAVDPDTLRMKLGHWMVKQSGHGLPFAVEYHACAGRDGDYVVTEEEGCTKPTLKREGTGYVVEWVCAAGRGGKAFRRLVITGDFNSAYTERKTTTFKPPLDGFTTVTENVEWRWIAPKCKPGMSSGDVEMISK